MVENFSSPKRSTITWPTLLDYTKIDCQRILRRLELEAYAKIVTVFRAQGPLTGEKRKTLQDLQRLLSIASDRHKAEVRRALNDEELATICESICGKEADDAWILEGKRIAPLLDRGIPQTAFLPRANLASAKWAELNSKLPRPYDTADKTEESGRDTDWVRSDEHRSSATGENVTSPVPEAAMEVTCEADISKTSASQSEMEKDANDNVPIGCNESANSLLCLPDNSTATSILVDADKQTRIEGTLSKSMFPLSSIKTSAEKEPSGLVQPSNGCQPYAHSNADFSPTAKRRIYGLPSQPCFPGSDEAPNNRQPVPLSTGLPIDQNKPGEVGGLSNGVTPLVSQSRSIIFGPSSNVISSIAPTATSSNNSQALQMTKVLGTSCGPDETTTASRLQHNTNTVVVTGASGTSTLVPQQSVVNTSPARLMKTHIFHPQQPQQIYSYTSFANAVPVASGSVAHLSAPSLPSDNKKQPVVIQQAGGAATSGNVIVVHRGASGRLIAGGASSAIHGSGITHTASTAVAGQPSSTVMPIAGATAPSGKPLRILSVPASIMSASSNTYTPTFHQTFSVSQRTAPSVGGANAPETPLSSEQGIYYYVTNPQHSGKNPSPAKPRSSAPVALKVFEAPAPPVPPSTLPTVDLDAECPERERTVHSSMTPDKPVRAKSSSVEKQPHPPAVSGCSVNILTVPGMNPRSPISVAATVVVPASSTVPAVPATASTVMTPVPVRPAFSKPAESATCAPVSLVSVLEPKRPRVAFVPSSQPL